MGWGVEVEATVAGGGLRRDVAGDIDDLLDCMHGSSIRMTLE